MLSFLNNYKNAIIAVGIIAFGIGCFSFGYNKAETEYLLQIESMKLAQAEAIIKAQNEARMKYEADVQKLSQALADAHSLNDDRMRQLQAFRDAGRDLDACLGERSALASLAIEGERLLKEADNYLGAVVK